MTRTLLLFTVAALACGTARGQAPAPAPSPAEQALEAAAHAGKFHFVLFWREDDDQTRRARRALSAGLARQPRAAWTAVRISDPAEKVLVTRYDLSRSPMPIVLAFAPNGAVTGAFPLTVSDAQIAQALVSPGTAGVLKALQSRKLVLLCVQPGGTAAVPAGVREFKADKDYHAATEVIAVSAADVAEQPLLRQMNLTGAVRQPVTVFMAPPGVMVGRFDGDVSRAALVEALSNCRHCSCPGGKCGPNGCACPHCKHHGAGAPQR